MRRQLRVEQIAHMQVQQLQAAQRLGCDFAVLGPVQATASHPDAVPLGWNAFAELRAQVSLPIYALGGMGRGHIAEARRVLAMPEAMGRRLDFLMQEFNREANTLGSKSVDSRTTQASVELKVLIDQIREQVQNIE